MIGQQHTHDTLLIPYSTAVQPFEGESAAVVPYSEPTETFGRICRNRVEPLVKLGGAEVCIGPRLCS